MSSVSWYVSDLCLLSLCFLAVLLEALQLSKKLILVSLISLYFLIFSFINFYSLFIFLFLLVLDLFCFCYGFDAFVLINISISYNTFPSTCFSCIPQILICGVEFIFLQLKYYFIYLETSFDPEMI